jgi:mono/diheme cytochrome c family protein
MRSRARRCLRLACLAAAALAAACARAPSASPSEAEVPPRDAWTEEQKAESAELWRTHCGACHGADGKLTHVPPMEPRPREWGTFGAQMGFFFGGDAMRAGIYRRIARGGDAEGRPSPMPDFEGRLSREQIWGLVFLLESF